MEHDSNAPFAPASSNATPRRRAVRRLLRAQILYAYALIVFAVLAVFAHIDAYFSWDLATAHALQALPLPGLYFIMRAASIFGDRWTPYLLTAVTMITFFALRRRSEAFGLILSVGGSALINRLIKVIIARPRPSSDLVRVFRSISSQSFPSGHVTFYVCYFGFLFFVAYALLPRRSIERRAALTVTALFVALIGFSRVYLGEHWPSDALGAYLLSGMWLAFSLQMYRYWKQRATFH
jgi:undecaprenyl-diphosphatase